MNNKTAFTISILAILISIFTLMHTYILMLDDEDSLEQPEFSQDEIISMIATIEVRALAEPCVDITWDSVPAPQNPNEAVEYINKCIHQYSTFDKTKRLIQDADYGYWPEDADTPDLWSGIDKLDFKNPSYPFVVSHDYFVN